MLSFCTSRNFYAQKQQDNKVHIDKNYTFNYKNKDLSSTLQLDISTPKKTATLAEFNKWKIKLWTYGNDIKNITGIQDITWGGGITNKYLTLGSISLQGDAKVFQNTDLLYAWSSRGFKNFRWNLKPPSIQSPLGLKVGYKYFDLWAKTSDAYNKNNFMYHAGLRVGHSFDIYTAQLLYQYTAQHISNTKDISKEIDSWYLTQSPALLVHSVGLIQSIDIPYLFIRALLRLSFSDTAPPSAHGSLLLDFPLKFMHLSIYAQVLDKHFVTSNLKYQKNLWTHSAQLQIPYKQIHLLRLRYALSGKNPITDYKFISSYQDQSHKIIKQKYEILWKHVFLLKKDIQHLIALEYIFNNQYSHTNILHKSLLRYTFTSNSWNINTGSSIDWYVNYTQLSSAYWNNTLKIDYLIDDVLTLFVHTKVSFEIYKTPQAPFRKLEIKSGIKLSYKKQASRTHVLISVPYQYDSKNIPKIAVDFSLRHTW